MKKESAAASRTVRAKQKLLEYLTESGNVSYSCKRAGISRETYYEWKAGDSVFALDAESAVDYGKSFVNDLAHTQLILNIQKGDMQAVRFQLVNCHPDYRPKLPERIEKKEEPISYVQIIPANCTHCVDEATDHTVP